MPSSAGRRWRHDSRVLYHLRLVQHGGQTPAESGGDCERHSGLLAHELEEGAAVQTQDLAIGLGFDGRSPRAVGEERHFSEWFAGVQDLHQLFVGAALAGRVDAHRSGRDQIKGVPRFSLPEDDRTRRVKQRLEVSRELSEGHPFQTHEQIDLAEKIGVTDVISLRPFGGARAGGRPLRGFRPWVLAAHAASVQSRTRRPDARPCAEILKTLE